MVREEGSVGAGPSHPATLAPAVGRAAPMAASGVGGGMPSSRTRLRIELLAGRLALRLR